MITITNEELKQKTSGMTREDCLNEAADRAMYFFKNTDGTYRIPECDPQTKQVLSLLFATTV